MSEERERVQCRRCELVQWTDRTNCRRCGQALPEPAVKVIERIVERVVVREDPQCLEHLEEARRLIVAATERLTQQHVQAISPVALARLQEAEAFPTIAEAERLLIAAAYERSHRKPLEAARLLGIGKTTVYRKLREMGKAA